MFKKSNRNNNLKAKRTVDNSDSAEDEEEATRPAPQPRSHINTPALAAVVVVKPKLACLSENIVDDDQGEAAEEDDTVEFKVKKSKESRRIAKEMKRSKREKERRVVEGGGGEQRQTLANAKSESSSSPNNILFNEGIRVKPLPVPVKRSTGRKFSDYEGNEEPEESEDEFKDYRGKLTSSSSDQDDRLEQKRENNGEQLEVNNTKKRIRN